MINSKKRLLGTLLASTIIGIFFATSSPLLGAPVPGGPGFISIGAFAFKPYLPGASYDFNIYNRLYQTSGQEVTFTAPVFLPHGATITQLILYFVDNGTSDITVGLELDPLDNPGSDRNVARMTTSGALPDQQTLVITPDPSKNIIDNQSNSYTVYFYLPSGPEYQIAGVRIDYSYPTNLPLIMK